MISYLYKDCIRIFVRGSPGAGEKIIPAQSWKTLLTLLLADPETGGDSFHFSEPQFCHLWNAHNKFRLAFLVGWIVTHKQTSPMWPCTASVLCSQGVWVHLDLTRFPSTHLCASVPSSSVWPWTGLFLLWAESCTLQTHRPLNIS